MKLEDVHTNKTACCKEDEAKSSAECCRNHEPYSADCCKWTEEQPFNGCCKEGIENQGECCMGTDDPSPGECCRAQEIHPYSSSTDREGKTKGIQEENQSNQDEKYLDHLQSLLIEANERLATANDKYIRLYSEFENFKKRSIKERIAITEKANEQTLKELLPIIDDFERCLNSLQGEYEGADHAMQEGIKLIHDKLCTFLKKFGVKEMQIEVESDFNADLHEAIMQKPVEQAESKGKIMAVVEKGYLLHEHVLRFAKVVTGV